MIPGLERLEQITPVAGWLALFVDEEGDAHAVPVAAWATISGDGYQRVEGLLVLAGYSDLLDPVDVEQHLCRRGDDGQFLEFVRYIPADQWGMASPEDVQALVATR